MQFLGYGCLIFAIVVLLNSHTGGGKRDRRYKTGYKGNNRPKYVPWETRLLMAAGLALVGGLILWTKIVLGLVALAIASYLFFPPVERWVSELLNSDEKSR